MTEARRTPLFALHRELGARMVLFAGHELPLHYAPGVLAEHLHTRSAASLFDVSHMGQVAVTPEAGDMAAAAVALEAVLGTDVTGLAEGRQRYALLTDATGGIVDDLMIARRADHFLLVVNAARVATDLAALSAGLGSGARAGRLDARALLALQGPGAEAALARLAPETAAMRFLDIADAHLCGHAAVVARSGYTGEDGFELSLAAEAAEEVAQALLDQPGVAPAGLGARDSLRLEAGLCLWGQDIDTTTTPGEAGLGWTIPPVRRSGGSRPGGFPGSARILAELDGAPAEVPARRRVGLRPAGRAPMRAGTPLFAGETDAAPAGVVTSGGHAPSLGAPVAMGYVPPGLAAPGTALWGELRGRRLPVQVVPLPFVPHRQKR